jgi:aspartyl/asparaginyl beta-hydroxylase (cupin superfamily)
VDVTAPHAVKNNSDVDRIHLVIDTYVNDEVRELLEVETFW